MKKLFFAALAATTLFASCAKENGNSIPQGEDTKMGLSFSFAGTVTRAIVDGNATTNEMKVVDVTVFIFDANGEEVTGNGETIAIEDFEETANNVYTLKEASKIATTTGVRRIYVGMNLPDGMKDDIESEEDLRDAMAIDMDELAAATGMAMFSTEVVEQALVLDETLNVVEVEVERMVAKVGASYATGKTAEFPIDGDATFTVTTFGIGQEATSMFPAKWLDNAGNLVTPGDRTAVVPSTEDWNTVDAAGTATTSLATFYVGENASVGNLRGEVTYAVFQATFIPENWTIITDDVLDTEENTEGTPVNTWVVKDGNTIYYCQSLAIAEDVQALLIDGGSLNPQVVEYAGGYCYYNVYLNADKATKYQLFRNDFIHLEIEDLTGLGYPGDPDKGGEEPDPDYPTEPELPIDEEDTTMLVKVSVKSWNYGAPVGITLQ